MSRKRAGFRARPLFLPQSIDLRLDDDLVAIYSHRPEGAGMVSTGRFYCEKCRNRFPTPGSCPRCVGEPLLDLADDEVRYMLESFDDNSRMRRYGQVVLVCAVFGALVWFVCTQLVGWIIAFAPAIGVTMGLSAVGMKIFPPRKSAPNLTSEEVQKLRAGSP
ncbi:hypothetical protein ACFL6C_07245 [Myxococcota bacterium]